MREYVRLIGFYCVDDQLSGRFGRDVPERGCGDIRFGSCTVDDGIALRRKVIRPCPHITGIRPICGRPRPLTAIERPMPPPAPVTTAVRPVVSFTGSSFPFESPLRDLCLRDVRKGIVERGIGATTHHLCKRDSPWRRGAFSRSKPTSTVMPWCPAGAAAAAGIGWEFRPSIAGRRC
jgi:hypothetical protein